MWGLKSNARWMRSDGAKKKVDHLATSTKTSVRGAKAKSLPFRAAFYERALIREDGEKSQGPPGELRSVAGET